MSNMKGGFPESGLDIEEELAYEEEPPNGVIVNVRVRPLFRHLEREKNDTNCVSMKGNITYIRDPEKPDEAPDKFAFDHAYWSSDKYAEQAGTGTNLPKPERQSPIPTEESPYASQATIWHDLGRTILGNAMKGFDATAFAYGQSGSGKSYSVVGYVVSLSTHSLTRLPLSLSLSLFACLN